MKFYVEVDVRHRETRLVEADNASDAVLKAINKPFLRVINVTPGWVPPDLADYAALKEYAAEVNNG
jgi:hypothetical protein